MSFFQRLFKTPPSRRGFNATEPELSFKDNIKALRNLPEFFRLIWQTSPSMTLGNVILRLIKAGIPLLTLLVGKLLIDEVIRLYNAGGGDMTWVWTLVGFELGLALASDLLSRGISLLDALLGDLFMNKTSVRLMDHAASLDLAQFEDSNFYDKLERARRQTTSRVVLMSQVLSQAQDLVTVVFLSAGLIVFNPWLILILGLAVLPAFLNETYFNQKSYSLARNWTPERRELDYLRYIGASDQTAKELKVFGLSDFLTGRFAEVADDYYEANKKLAIRRAIWGSVFNMLGVFAYYGAYIVIILQTVGGSISIGDMTFLAGSFERLRNLLQGILSRFSSIAQSALYLQDLFDFFNIRPEIRAPEKVRPLPEKIQEGFTFEQVGFKYPGSEKWALRNVSFTLKAGEKLALVGENGAGKTTLVKLLARLYEPSEGRILLDGHDLREYDPDELRKVVGVIFQDFVRYAFSAKENIAVGNIGLRSDQPKIQDSAGRGMADKVIEKLPDKYDQMLGRRFKNGVELSGGEWQKVALSRAYMREAGLLILDEPTAALDARAEYEVFQRFSELMEGKTAVLISHRFSTVRMADRILVLKGGEPQEIGSHGELLENKGLYAELFELQAEGYR